MVTVLGVIIVFVVIILLVFFALYSRRTINTIAEKKYSNLREIMYNRAHGKGKPE